MYVFTYPQQSDQQSEPILLSRQRIIFVLPKNNKQQTTTIPNSALIMVYLRVAIILSLALHCNSLIINVVAQLRDGIRNGRPNSGWALENIGSAVSIAIEDFQAKGLLTEHTFR